MAARKRNSKWEWGPAAYVGAVQLLLGVITLGAMVFGVLHDIKFVKAQAADLKTEVSILKREFRELDKTVLNIDATVKFMSDKKQ